MTGGGRGFCAGYLPAGAGYAAPPYYQASGLPMGVGPGGWGSPYAGYGAPYAAPYGGFGQYPFRPFGMGMGMGMGRGFGMGFGRGFGMGMGRGMRGGGRGRWW